MGLAATVSFHPSASGVLDLDWDRAVWVASAAGYRAIDVPLLELLAKRPADTEDQMEAAGVVAGPASLPLEFRRDEATFERGLADLPRLADLAARLGVRAMVRSIPSSTDVPAREAQIVLRRRLSACAQILAERGIDLVLEPIGPLHRRREGAYELMWRLADVADFALSCHPNAGVLVDAWHWHHAGERVADILAVAPLVRHVHVADAANLPPQDVRDRERLLPGRGVIDLGAFAEALDRIGYVGFVSPEVLGYPGVGDEIASARATLNATAATLRVPPPRQAPVARAGA